MNLCDIQFGRMGLTGSGAARGSHPDRPRKVMRPKEGRRELGGPYRSYSDLPTDGIGMANKRRSQSMQGAGAIDQLPGRRWRLRVPLDTGGRLTYGTHVTERVVELPRLLYSA